MGEREHLVRLIEEACGGCARYRAEDIADHLISEGVVDVVRCKDCKHRYEPTKCALWYGQVNEQQYFIERGSDFYCSYGERSKTDG